MLYPNILPIDPGKNSTNFGVFNSCNRVISWDSVHYIKLFETVAKQISRKASHSDDPSSNVIIVLKMHSVVFLTIETESGGITGVTLCKNNEQKHKKNNLGGGAEEVLQYQQIIGKLIEEVENSFRGSLEKMYNFKISSHMVSLNKTGL